jgi:3',5'-cyclic AMP phosphodiesterase CpdA
VLLLHHPPVTNAVSWRRGLTDAPALQALIARHGVELVLFGHTHRTITATLPGPHGPVPVLGAPSVTARRGGEGRRSRYFLYTVRRTARGWAIRQRERRLDVAQSGFVDGVQREFAL